jgi:putative aminopeptidase FrvX
MSPDTDAPVEGDIRKTAAKVLTSATKVRVSVEDRRLSLGVLGKSSEELQKQLDSCELRIDEGLKEKKDLKSLQSDIGLSSLTLEILLNKPGVSREEKRVIRSKLEELGRLQKDIEARDGQLTELDYRLIIERSIIRAQLDQLPDSQY